MVPRVRSGPHSDIGLIPDCDASRGRPRCAVAGELSPGLHGGPPRGPGGGSVLPALGAFLEGGPHRAARVPLRRGLLARGCPLGRRPRPCQLVCRGGRGGQVVSAVGAFLPREPHRPARVAVRRALHARPGRLRRQQGVPL